MPRISNIEILHKREQPTLFIRTTASVARLQGLIGDSFGRMAAYLQECGECLADMPYVAYHNMDMKRLDVEIGFPVAKPLPGRGDIQSGLLPAGKKAFCMYRGAYNEIEPVYNEMIKWIEDHGYTFAGPAYESYYNGPEYPTEDLLTMVTMPLA